MKEINLNINVHENKLPLFLELMNSLDFVSVNQPNDWYNDLSNRDKKSIKKGLDDLKNGNTLTHEQVMLNVKNKIQQLKNS